VLRDELPKGLGELAGGYIEPALVVLPQFPCDLPAVLTGGTPLADLAQRTCVAGDLHEIGVRMVSDFFEVAGWNTFYLGADTPADSVVRILRERQADMLAISVTMTFHLRAVTELIGAVRASSACRRVKILVGGHPFNAFPDLPRRIGADASAVSAEESVAVAAQLMQL